MGWPYQQKPPMGWPLDYDSGLVPETGFWPMLEGAGNIVQDLSGNGNAGTFVGDVSWTSGKYGSSVLFKGITDYITVVENGSLRFDSATQDFTIIAIVNKTIGGQDGYVLDKRDSNDDGWRFVAISGVMWFSIDGADVKGSTSIEDGKTHMIGVVINRSGNGQIYIDGLADGTPVVVSGEGAMATTTAMTMGTTSFSPTSNEWLGQVEAVYIYNRALTASEITQLYSEPFCMFKDPAEVVILGGQGVVGNAGIMTTNTGYWGPTF